MKTCTINLCIRHELKQFDVKDDKNNENEEDDLYEIPTSSKLPDKLPDGCRFAVSNVTLLLYHGG
jgi:hypothetical protein